MFDLLLEIKLSLFNIMATTECFSPNRWMANSEGVWPLSLLMFDVYSLGIGTIQQLDNVGMGLVVGGMIQWQITMFTQDLGRLCIKVQQKLNYGIGFWIFILPAAKCKGVFRWRQESALDPEDSIPNQRLKMISIPELKPQCRKKKIRKSKIPPVCASTWYLHSTGRMWHQVHHFCSDYEPVICDLKQVQVLCCPCRRPSLICGYFESKHCKIGSYCLSDYKDSFCVAVFWYPCRFLVPVLISDLSLPQIYKNYPGILQVQST